MALIGRRLILATAGGTLAAGLGARKPRAEGLTPLEKALEPMDPPADLPDTPFVDADGKEHRLSEFRGRGMVVNLWATWCAPCVAEMPSLAALSKALAPADIAVLPLSSDRGGAPVVEAWFRSHGISSLPVLLDPKGTLARSWKARGIPTTVLVDKDGKGRARLEGAADWASPQAASAVRKLLAG